MAEVGDFAPGIRDRDVLLVDDIFDTGHTLWELIPQIDELGPASLRVTGLAVQGYSVALHAVKRPSTELYGGSRGAGSPSASSVELRAAGVEPPSSRTRASQLARAISEPDQFWTSSPSVPQAEGTLTGFTIPTVPCRSRAVPA